MLKKNNLLIILALSCFSLKSMVPSEIQTTRLKSLAECAASSLVDYLLKQSDAPKITISQSESECIKRELIRRLGLAWFKINPATVLDANEKISHMALGLDHVAAIVPNGLLVWNIHTLESKKIREPFTPSALIFSLNDTFLITKSGATIRLWDMHTLTCRGKLPDYGCTNCPIALNADGNCIATQTDFTVRLWDVHTLTFKDLKGHSGIISSLAFSPDGDNLVTGSLDTTVRIWDVKTGLAIKEIKGPSPAFSVAYSPRGNCIAASFDPELILWDLNHLTEKKIKTLFSESITFSPDGNLLATKTVTGIRLWNVQDLTSKELRNTSRFGLFSRAFSPDGTSIVGYPRGNTANLWDLETLTSQELKGHTQKVISAQFSQDGNFIATGAKDGIIQLWDMRYKNLPWLQLLLITKLFQDVSILANSEWLAIFDSIVDSQLKKAIKRYFHLRIKI